jgi:purine-binding chemotaxis protein CheW
MNDSCRRFIVFSLRGERYALDIRDVAEVMEPPPTYPIPRAPHYFAGIVNFHGTLVAALDLAMFLGGEPGLPGEKILVLDKNIANLAFQVDTVEDIMSDEAVLEEREGIDAMTASLLVMADGEVKVLAVRPILEKLEASING